MYKYRRGVPSDVNELIDLLGELTALEEDFDFDEVAHRKGLELLLVAPVSSACVIVAVSDSRVVGMCTGQVVISTAMGGGSVWVEDVVVTAEHRGLGVGRGMLGKLQQWSQDEAGASRMQLWADKDNESAIKFYKNNAWATANAVVLKKVL